MHLVVGVQLALVQNQVLMSWGEVLKLPEPKPSSGSRGKRKGVNSMAVHITDSDFLKRKKKRRKQRKLKSRPQRKKESRTWEEKSRTWSRMCKKREEREWERRARRERKGEASIQAEMHKLFLDSSGNECSSVSESSGAEWCWVSRLWLELPWWWYPFCLGCLWYLWCMAWFVWRDFKCTGLLRSVMLLFIRFLKKVLAEWSQQGYAIDR